MAFKYNKNVSAQSNDQRVKAYVVCVQDQNKSCDKYDITHPRFRNEFHFGIYMQDSIPHH